MFDGELKSQGLSAANANQIKVFQGSLVKCFEFAGKALQDALANTDEDADVFQEESFGLKLEGEVGTAFANIQKISSFHVLASGSGENFQVMAEACSAFNFLFQGAPLQLLTESFSGTNEANDIDVCESLARVMSCLRKIQKKPALLNIMGFGADALTCWVTSGAERLKSFTKDFILPKLTSVQAIIFSDASAGYWKFADGAYTCIEFLDTGDVEVFAKANTNTVDHQAVVTQLAHIENACVAMEAVHLSNYLQAVWCLTQLRWASAAIVQWKSEVGLARNPCCVIGTAR